MVLWMAKLMCFPRLPVKIFNTLFLLLVFTVSVYAADNCQENDDTYGMRDCLNSQFKTADQELNAIYQKLLKSDLEVPQRKALIKAELDWIKFRDSQCALEGSFFEGGTIEPIEQESCTVNLTKERTKQLKALIKRMND